MLLPKNGRIVVIDDKQEEALPLLKSLWQNGFSAIYFSGEKKELPSVPLDNARVIFLDMELETGGYTGSDNKTKSATTARVLKSIINTNQNVVYLIIMWAMHEELEGDFWTYIREDSNCDFIQLKLDKTKCMTNEDVLAAEIASVLKSNNAFNFFINWENMINKSSNDIVLDFSSFFSVDAAWDRKVLEILKKLAEEYAGKNLNASNHEQIVRYAMLALNETFTDSLENNIFNISNTGISFASTTGDSDKNVIAKINSKLLLSHGISSVKPGNIYEDNNKLIDSLIKDLFDKPDSVDKSLIKVVFCEASPFCDYAQNNWRVHRIIYGLLIPLEFDKKVKKKAEYVYISPVFEMGSSAKKLVFNLRNLQSIPIGELKDRTPVFTLRHHLLVDIQHKIGSHASRPGYLSVN